MGTNKYAIPISGDQLLGFIKANSVSKMMHSGLVGNDNGMKMSGKSPAKNAVISFIKDVADNEGGPYATHFVYQITGMTLQMQTLM